MGKETEDDRPEESDVKKRRKQLHNYSSLGSDTTYLESFRYFFLPWLTKAGHRFKFGLCLIFTGAAAYMSTEFTKFFGAIYDKLPVNF